MRLSWNSSPRSRPMEEFAEADDEETIQHD
jgi:hypothetical protein